MRIPTKIEVDHKTYKVKLVNKHKIRPVSGGKSKFLGESNVQDQWIRIAAKQHTDELKTTLLHEITHIIADVEGIKMPEVTVERFSRRMYQVLKTNHLKF